jgi:hypothetical protein
MRKHFLLPLVAAAFAANSNAATLASYDFGTTSGVVGNLVLTSANADANSTAGAFAAGAGITNLTNSVGNSGRAIGASLATSFSSLLGVNSTTAAEAVTNNDYFTFTLTPSAGYQLNLTQLSFDFQSSGTVNNAVQSSSYTVFSSVGGFSSGNHIDSGTWTYLTDTGWKSLTLTSIGGVSFHNLITATEFRIYLSDAGSNSNSVFANVDNVILDGTDAAIPEPSTAALLLGSMAGLLVALRRKRA